MNQINNDQQGVTRINADVDDSPKLQEQTPPQVATSHEIEIDDSEPAVPEEPVAPTPVPEPIQQVTRKTQKVTQEFNINSTEEPANDVTVVLPATFDKETREVLQNLPNFNLLDNPTSRKWAADVSEGLGLTTFNETFVPTLEDEEADFRHRFEDSGMSLTAAAPKFKSVQNENLRGERAVIRLISHLGLGTLFQVPLWHSGLWVTFKPPAESEIIELNRILMSDKIRFGRYSYGLVFSNISSYTTDRLVDFALAHVYDITAKAEEITAENLKSHLSCQDIPSFLWGFVCSMYPKGFKYHRACVADPEKCNYVLQETLNVTKLQWTNVAALTEWQKTFMAGRQPKTKDLASITRYKEELTRLKNKRIVINEGKANEIAIVIKTPTVTEHVEAGYRWISDIVDIVDRTLGLNTTDDERNNFITRYGQASAMRQYIHWVSSIEYETNVIDDLETIENTLNVLSSDDEVRTQFLKGVSDYINASTISVIGIPVYDCPNCGHVEQLEHHLPAHKNIIPLDVIQLFFALLSGKIESLTTR